jgi:LacI family transcriptional regulator
LHKYDIPQEPELIVECTNNDEEAYRRIKNLFESPNRPDGVFASVEKLATITYAVCQELSLQIPQDIKLICFSNLKIASLLSPPLSTITQTAFEIGKEAANILFQHLDRKRASIPNENIVLKSVLVPRASSQEGI